MSSLKETEMKDLVVKKPIPSLTQNEIIFSQSLKSELNNDELLKDKVPTPKSYQNITNGLIHKKKLEFKQNLKENFNTKIDKTYNLRKFRFNEGDRNAFLTDIKFEKKIKPSNPKKKELKFSPLIEQYLRNKKHINKNCTAGFKIKLTPYHSNLLEIEKKNKIFDEKFNKAMKIAKYYEKKLKSNTLNKVLNKEINQIKFQALENSKRLHKRKIEETKNGAHEYANYILSILNSNIKNY